MIQQIGTEQVAPNLKQRTTAMAMNKNEDYKTKLGKKYGLCSLVHVCVVFAVSADSGSGSGSGSSGSGTGPSVEPLTAGQITGIVIGAVVIVAAIVLVIGVGAWW